MPVQDGVPAGSVCAASVSVKPSAGLIARCVAWEQLHWRALILADSLCYRWVRNVWPEIPAARWNGEWFLTSDAVIHTCFFWSWMLKCELCPGLLGAARGASRHVLFARRNGSGLFCGSDSSSLCPRARPPWERAGQSRWQWWTSWNNRALPRSPVSHIPASHGNRPLPPTAGESGGPRAPRALMEAPWHSTLQERSTECTCQSQCVRNTEPQETVQVLCGRLNNMMMSYCCDVIRRISVQMCNRRRWVTNQRCGSCEDVGREGVKRKRQRCCIMGHVGCNEKHEDNVWHIYSSGTFSSRKTGTRSCVAWKTTAVIFSPKNEHSVIVSSPPGCWTDGWGRRSPQCQNVSKMLLTRFKKHCDPDAVLPAQCCWPGWTAPAFVWPPGSRTSSRWGSWWLWASSSWSASSRSATVTFSL